MEIEVDWYAGTCVELITDGPGHIGAARCCQQDERCRCDCSRQIENSRMVTNFLMVEGVPRQS